MKKLITLCFLLALVCVEGWGQTAANYTFATGTGGTSGTLETVPGTATLLVAANSDDGTSGTTAVSFGFNFVFAGTTYTQLSANANGLIRLGATVINGAYGNTGSGSCSNANSGFLTTCNLPEIAPYFDDIYTGSTASGGGVRGFVTGASPNRKVVIDFKVTVPRSAGSATNANFQVWLEETTNKITFVYGSNIAANTANGGYTVGIAATTSDFQSVTTSNNTSSTTAHNGTQTNAISSGRYYTFTPVSCILPTNFDVTGVTSSQATLIWTASTSTPPSYDIYITTSATAPTATTTPTYTGVTGTSRTITGLTPGTTYNAYIRSACGGTNGNSVWSDAVSFTTAPVNDECTGAVAITPATSCTSVSGTNVSATTSTGFTQTCTPTGVASDVWYSFTADGTSSYTVTLNPDAAGRWTVSLFSGTCGSLTAVSCLEGAAAGGTVTLNAGILSAGTYYYRVYARSEYQNTFTTCITYIGNPSITSFTPGSTCSGGGTTVTITGNNFTGTTAVAFNGVSATFTVVNNTTITATVPASATTGAITVTNPVNTATSSTPFTVNAKPTVAVSPTSATVCNGTPTTLTASGADTYTWTPTAGLSATTGNPVIATPTATTTYTVTGTTTATGCTNTATSAITVNQPPSTSVAGPNQTLCGTSAVTLNATAPTSGAGTWSVASGPSTLSSQFSSTTLRTATFTPAGGVGVYVLTWTVSNAPCTPSASNVTITYNANPTVAVSPTSATVCNGTATTLTASGADTYVWTPTAGLSATTGNPVIATPTATTTYTVTGKITATGCTNTATSAITVNQPPSTSVAGPNQTLCGTSTVTLAANNPTSGTGAWSVASGPSTASSQFSSTTLRTATFTPAGGVGVYVLTWTVSNAPCASSASNVTITYNANPTVAVSPTSATVCNGTATTLTASGADTYVWTPTAGLSATTGNPVIATPTATTTYTVTGKITATGCTNTATSAITVNQPPSTSVAGPNQTLCGTSAVTLNATAPTSGAGTWSVASGPSTLSSQFSSTTLRTATFTPAGGVGVYVLTWTVSNAPCASSASNVTITYNTIPTVTVSPTSASICSGAATVLTASGADIYTWSPATELSATTGNPVTATPTANRTYTVTGKITATGCINTATSILTVSTPPTTVTISSSPSTTTICAGDNRILTASGGNVTGPSTALSETFDNSAPSWTVVNNSSANVIPWTYATEPYSAISSGNVQFISFVTSQGGKFAFSNSDAGGTSTTTTSTTLTSPTFSLANYTSATLTFEQNYRAYSADVTVAVEISKDGGVTWATLNNYKGTNQGTYTTNGTGGRTVPQTTASASVAIPATYLGQANLKIRYNYVSTWGWYWIIDNVVISGQAVTQAAITWLPTTGLTPTTGATVTATPPTTTSYTATATTNGCSVSSSPFTITVNPLPVPTFTTAPGSQVCGATDVTYTTQAGQSNYVWSGFGTPGTDYTVTSGSIASTSNTVTVKWLTTGNKTVTVNYSSNNCSGASPASSSTNVLAYPAAYTVSGGGGYCSADGGQSGTGVNINLNGSQTGVTYELYVSNADNGNTPTSTGTVLNGTGSPLNFSGILTGGTYTVFATNTTTLCTQFMTSSATVTVNAFPTDYVVSSSGTTCGTGTIFLSGSDFTSPATAYTLRRTSPTPVTVISSQNGTGNPLNFIVTQSGTYSITATNSSCQNGMGSAIVTINPRPTPSLTVSPNGPYCSGQNNVTYTTQSGSGINSYVWTVVGTQGIDYTITAGGISSSDNTVTLTWLTAGSKTVTVNYNNSFGCNGLSAATSTITVNQTPVIANKTTTAACNGSFSVTPATGGGDVLPTGTTYTWTAPTTAGVTGTASGTNQSSISGTLTNTTSSPVAVVYNVTATAGSCSSTFTLTVTVNPVPSIAAKSTTAACNGSFSVTPTNGTDIVPAGTTYSWSTPTGTGFTGGAAGSGNSITGTLTNTTDASVTATYTVTATSGTCTSNFTVTVTVKAVSNIANKTSTICSGNTFTVTPATSGGDIVPVGTTYSWSAPSYSSVAISGGAAGSGNSISGTLINSGTAPGTATYTVTPVSGSGCTGNSSFTMTVTVNPDAHITLTSAPSTTSQTVCTGVSIAPITYSVSGGGTGASVSGLPASFTGNYSGGVFTISGSASVTTTTTYTYTVTTTGSCAQTSATGTVTVQANATIALTSGAGTNAQTLCSGSGAITNITYAIGGSGNGASASGLPTGVTGSYSGGVFTISGTSSVSGTFNYTVTTTGPCVTPSATGTITINQTPTASIAAATPSFACEGAGVSLTISATPGAIVSYTINNGTTQTTSPIPAGGSVTINSPTNTGVYNYLITDVVLGTCNGAGGSAASVTINPNPTLVLSSTGNGDRTQCGYNAIDPIVYTFGGGATGATVTITPSNQGISYTPGTNTITITGTPTTTGVITYSITTTGGSCGDLTLSGTINITPYSWIGGNDNNNWSNADNWCGGIPAAGANVMIDASLPKPVLSQDVTVGNLTVNSNVVVINGHTLTLNGAFGGNGSLAGSPSSNLITGQSTAVRFIQNADSNYLHNLQVVGGTLTLGNALNITAGSTGIDYGVVTVSGDGQLATGGNLTLKSGVNGTAAVGTYTGTAHPTNYITGNVTTERYTDGGVAAGKRAWRLITSPVAGQTISQAWQEGQVYNAQSPGSQTGTYGTIITGDKFTSGTAANVLGFDYVGGGNNTSIRKYNPLINNWQPLANGVGTNTTLVHDEPAYMLFIRGDRTKNTPSAVGPGNIRATGTLFQGPQPLPVSATNPLTLVGNPYAAPVNFADIYTGNSSVIQNVFYAWDTHLNDFGGFVTVDGTGGSGYTAVPTDMNSTGTVHVSQFVQSGEGFFVVPNNGGTMNITENMKAVGQSTATSASPFREVPANSKQLRVNLNVKTSDTSAKLADGFLAKFDDGYAGIEEESSRTKAWNFNENLNLIRGGKYHVIEARDDVKKADTLFVQMWNVSKRAYQLQMRADNFNSAAGTQAWLVDNYLGTKQTISLSGNVVSFDFTVTSDSNSAKTNRFLIVFQNNAIVLPVTLTSVKAAQQNGGVTVSWTVTNEVNIKGYAVEKSPDGRTFTSVSTQQAAKNNPQAALTNYSGYDATPKAGDNYYRIRIEDNDGKVSYSEIVKVTIGAGGTGIQITLYPNPVRDGKANLVLTNLTEGTYLVSVFSGSGQTVYQKKVTVTLAGTTQSEQLLLGNGIAQGSYQIRVADHKGVILFTDKLIVGR